MGIPLHKTKNKLLKKHFIRISMKKIILLLFVTIIVSCQQKKSEISTDNSQDITIENFDWLLGQWERTNDEEGRKTYENWTKINEKSYSGVGFAMKENDTISKELIQLLNENNTWSLKVITKEDSSPTVFQVVVFDATSFTCENAKNEFPKKIRYSAEGKKMFALISGDGMEISFEFEKINP